jgi:hypothetical protein
MSADEEVITMLINLMTDEQVRAVVADMISRGYAQQILDSILQVGGIGE